MNTYIPQNIVQKHLDSKDQNYFFSYLEKQYGKEKMEEVISKYKVGTSTYWPGATVFFQIDHINRVKVGKIMLYEETGKRKRGDRNYVQWVHKVEGLKDFDLEQCLFGQHLINDISKPIAIVESEKTAIICSIHLPQLIWLATGGKENLSEQKLLPLKNRKIILYPDLGAFEVWKDKIKGLKGFNISISEVLKNNASEEDRNQGLDLADRLQPEKKDPMISIEPNNPNNENFIAF